MPLNIVIIILLTSLISPQTGTKKITLTEDVKEIKRTILKLIPVGSRVSDAKEILEQDGFTCELKENAAFVEYDEQKRDILHEGEDFLWCDQSKRVAEMILRRWQVIVTHKNEIVSNVYVSTGLIAP